MQPINLQLIVLAVLSAVGVKNKAHISQQYQYDLKKQESDYCYSSPVKHEMPSEYQLCYWRIKRLRNDLIGTVDKDRERIIGLMLQALPNHSTALNEKLEAWLHEQVRGENGKKVCYKVIEVEE